MSKELSIFIDESGDFGEYATHSPYYIISMIFHDQSFNITEDLKILERELSNCGYSNHCIHSGPIIRGEEEYRFESLAKRQQLIRRMMTFLRHINITHKTFYVEKKHVEDSVIMAGTLSKQIAAFIRKNINFFFSFDKIIIYYDNGQVELNKILSTIFNVLLDNVEFRKVIPADYRLFQIADLMCTLQLEKLKLESNTLSKSDLHFFESKKALKKHYIRFFENLEHK